MTPFQAGAATGRLSGQPRGMQAFTAAGGGQCGGGGCGPTIVPIFVLRGGGGPGSPGVGLGGSPGSGGAAGGATCNPTGGTSGPAGSSGTGSSGTGTSGGGGSSGPSGTSGNGGTSTPRLANTPFGASGTSGRGSRGGIPVPGGNITIAPSATPRFATTPLGGGDAAISRATRLASSLSGLGLQPLRFPTAGCSSLGGLCQVDPSNGNLRLQFSAPASDLATIAPVFSYNAAE